MFKNATLYRINASPSEDFCILDAMEAHAFTPCDSTQEVSHGWVAPREPSGDLVECINGQLVYKLMTETKTVPADVLEREINERCTQIEVTAGRKPGAKERREIKEEALLSLLPQAFPKRTATLAWINPSINLLVIDTASAKRADEVVTALLQAQEGLALQPIASATAPSAAMAAWLTQVARPETLGIDTDCVLASEEKTKVKYVKHNLDIPEVKEHIAKGMRPESLALTWLNRVSFTLTDALTIKGIDILDVPPLEEDADAFDADVCIVTSEITSLVHDLLQELGGENATTHPAE
jgi:recombination associated protein RdgC